MSLTNAQDQVRSARQDEGPAHARETVAPALAAGPASPVPVAGLMVGSADATAEKDADALADRALRRLGSGAQGSDDGPGTHDVHAHGAGCGHLRRAVQPTAGGTIGYDGGELDATTSSLIASRKGGGTALPTDVRRSMETAFGTGLGHVRIHDDPVAANLNRAVSARAFTTGADIFFGAGEYAPQDLAGRRVLAHELAHVVTEGPGTGVRRLMGWIKSKLRMKQEAKPDDAAKALEPGEDRDLAESRKEGQAGRAQLRSQLYGDNGKQSGENFQELQNLFAEVCSEEELTMAILRIDHAHDPEWTEEHTIEAAYQATWVDGRYAATLASVAPARKTSSERLILDVRRARTRANVRQAARPAVVPAVSGVAAVKEKTAKPLLVVGGVKAVIKEVGKHEDKKLAPTLADDQPQSVLTEVAGGISTVTTMFTGLLDSVEDGGKFVKAVDTALGTLDPRDALGAAKAGFDGLTAFTKSAKNTADLAKLISPGIAESVGKVVPGLNLALALASLGKSIIILGESARRMDDATTALFVARTRKPDATEVDVMVRPMLQVSQRFTKELEKAAWNTGIAVSEVGTSIASVATAGAGVAVQAGISAINTLHSFGHLIADQVLASFAKALEGESIEHLEGAAENQMRSNAGIAVDGIIMSGARGDKVAVAFLANYSVDGRPVTAAMLAPLRNADPESVSAKHDEDNLLKIRSEVLKGMGTTADPKYIYETWQEKAAPLLARWGATGELADQHNALDNPGGAADVDPAKGFVWRVGLMLSEEKRDQSTKEMKATRDAMVARGVVIACGKAALTTEATPAEQEAFVAELSLLPDDVILAASKEPTISPAARSLLLTFVQDRLKKTTAGTTGKGAS